MDAHTGADRLLDRIADLPAERRALVLARLSAARTAVGATSITPSPRTPDRAFPMTPGQEEIYFVHRLAPESSAYNVPVVRRISGPLDVEALGRALHRLVDRHEPLRTSFGEVGGRPMQTVRPNGGLPLRIGAADDEGDVLAQARLDGDRPFDLSGGRPVRARLLRLGPDEHALVLTCHHIACDGWSVAVMWRDLVELYRAEVDGPGPDLPELTVQHADFALWQERLLASPAGERLSDYWRADLAGLPTLDLPADHPRPPQHSFRGAVASRPFPPGTAAAVRELSRRERATPFMVLLAAFYTVLHSATGQRDIPVGTLTSGRRQPGLEHVVGFFVNTIVLRGDLAGDPTFAELLGRVRRKTLDGFAHEQMPLRSVARWLRPGRDAGRTPLIGALFTFAPGAGAWPEAAEPPGLRTWLVEPDSQVARFDLAVNVIEHDGELLCLTEYNTDLFRAPTVERLAASFAALVATFTADPGRRLSEAVLAAKLY